MKYILGVIVLIALSGCMSGTGEDRNPNKPMSFQQGIGIMLQGQSQAEVIESFARFAAAGDVEALLEKMAPLTRRSAGDANIRTVLSQEIIPFFADYKALDTYKTINGADFPDGSTGLVHYTYIVTRDGTKKPISIALIDDGASVKVVNVEVDRCIRGRHPVSEGRCE